MPRIALIHALAHSMAPIQEEFRQRWPGASLVNLLDDSLSSDLQRDGGIAGPAMFQRFRTLADYAVANDADAILYTCSAFGACIDAVRQAHPRLPILKPNEAMIAEALRHPGPIGLIASFGPTVHSMQAEFPPGRDLLWELADGALAALNRGDTATHDALVVDAARRLVGRGAGVIALAQFSLARSAPAIRAALQQPVLTTVGSALDALRSQLKA